MASNNNRSAIRQAYNDYLGRDADDSEVEGWVSGGYGKGGISDWLNQIKNSDEGQRYRLKEAYLDYLGREAEGSEIEKWMSGGYGGGGIDNWLNQIQNSKEAKAYAARSQAPQPDPTPPDVPITRGGTNTSLPTGETGSAPDESDLDTPQSGSPSVDPSTPKAEVIDHDYEYAVEQLRAAYREHIGREASDAEIQGWWSGDYKWGEPGFGGLEGWLRGIKHEGDRLKNVAAGTTSTNTGNTGVPARTGRAPDGWDQTKWADPDHHTTKYDVAAFLYGVTEPSEVKSIVESAAFQARFPGATFDGKDKIDFGDNLEDGVPVGVIDVLMQADRGGNTSKGLWWGDTQNDPAPETTGGGTTGGGTTGGGTTGGGTTGGGTTGGGTTGGGTTGGWTQPPDSPLFNPPATAGPPSLNWGMGPGGGGGTMGNMITPYNPLATYSPTPYTPPAPFRPPSYQGATPLQQDDYQAATPFEQANYTAATPFQQNPYQAATPFGQDPYAAAAPFEGPTAEDMAADPSYQFRLQQGQLALERSGAARGVTNTGGTLRDILDYGQQAASQEYGNIYGRQRDAYDLNERNRFNAYQANYGNAMNAYAMNEQNRAGAFDMNAANRYRTYAMNEANRAGAFDRNAANQFQAYGMNEANRAGAFDMNAANRYRTYMTNEANRAGVFDRNVGTARDAYAMNEENRYRGYTTNEIARLQQNQEAENRRMGAYNTNLAAYQNQQRFRLQAQGQGFDQAYRNWAQRWYQGSQNAQNTWDRMYPLGTT